MIVTGIGARKTPGHILDDMQRVGEWCREHRVPLRSGHAEGADWAFERGAQELCIAYLPWSGFNAHLQSAARKPLCPQGEEVSALIQEVHPAPERLTSGARKLHGRNAFQILGSKLSTPTSAVVCWTPGGKVVGGTATAIRLAEGRGIPVYNLALVSVEEVLVRLDALRLGVDVRACDLPPQPGDEEKVGDSDVVWGELFGRSG